MKACFVILYIIFGCSAFAQNMSGYVYDENHKPIPYATLHVEKTNTSASTDLKGFYQLNTLESESLTVSIQRMGYEKQEFLIDSVKQNPQQNFQLKSKENILNTVVITGTKTNKLLKDSPVLTNVIQGEMLHEIGAVTALDALESTMPGMFFNPNSHGDNIQMQGLDNKYILVLLNGERMVNGRTENVNFSRLNVADIERIEIIDGAASVLYGSNAMGAVINVITKEVKKPFEAFVQGRYSNYNTYGANGALGFKWRELVSRTTLNTKGTDGYTLTDQLNDGTTYERIVTPNSDFSVSQEFKYQFSPKVNARLYGSFFSSLLEYPSNPVDNKERDYNLGANVNYLVTKKNALTFSANTDIYEAYKLYKRRNDSLALGNDYSITTLRVVDVWSPSAGIQVVGGYEFNNEQSYSGNLFGTETSDESTYDNNFFAQGDFTIFKKLEAVIGARVTQHSEFGVHFTPKISLMYSLSDFRFRAGISNGFKAPSLKEMYYDFLMTGNTRIEGNPDLKPENSWYESVSVEYMAGNFSASVMAYNNHISNKIDAMEYIYADSSQLSTVWKYENIGNVRIQGFDVSLQWRFLKYLYLNGSYAFANAVDKETGLQLNGNSKHNITTSLMFKNSDFRIHNKEYPFSFVFSGRFSSPRIYETEITGTPGVFIRTESKTTSIWRIVYTQGFPQLYKSFGLELQLGIDNIFDWTDPIRSINPGRTYFVSLKMNI